jgi:hypothetical protein
MNMPERGKHLFDADRRARLRPLVVSETWERPPTARRYNEERYLWQAMESSKSPMRTSTRMF